jgi:hypothetical protein
VPRNYIAMSLKFSGSRLLAIALPSVLVQLIVFKLLYPYASFFYTDSFGYITAAVYNQDAATWPVGYSKFLRLFDTFIHSDTALVSFQYLFLQTAGLYFVWTLSQLFRPRAWVCWSITAFILFNPLSLYLANSISSDAMFTGLSLCWLSILLKMLHRPSHGLIFLQALLLVILFKFRNNALYYPLIALLAILLSRYRWPWKALAIFLPAVGLFICGATELSPFGGWQAANNALYAYSHVPKTERVQPQAAYVELDKRVTKYYDTVHALPALEDSRYPGIWYLWDPHSPLAMHVQEQRKTWAGVAPLYADYAGWLVRRYPGYYARYFVAPNTVRFLLPPLEFMDRYNSGEDTVASIAQHWFRYADNKVRPAAGVKKSFQARLLRPYQWLYMAINLFFAAISIMYFSSKRIRSGNPFSKYLLLLSAGWLTNLLFSISSAPVVIRYEIFWVTGVFAFSLLVVDRMPVPVARVQAQKAVRIPEICGYTLCFLFVYGACVKLMGIDLFSFQLQRYPWINLVSNLVAWAVPLSQLGIAALLLTPRTRHLGLYASMGLLSLFTVYIVAMLQTQKDLPCSCGGIVEGIGWAQQAWMNAVFIAIGAVGLYFNHHKNHSYER